MRKFALLIVLALPFAAAAPAEASPQARFGIQDDAWLVYGPGTLDDRLDTLDRLGVDVVRWTIRWDQVAKQRPTSPRLAGDPAYDWSLSDDVLAGLRRRGIGAVVTLLGTPRWANGGRAWQVAPTPRRRLRGLRRRDRAPLPVGPRLDDLERAEPAALAEPGLGADVRGAAAQPGLRRAQGREPQQPGRRRRHRPARERRRHVPGRLHPRDACGAGAARRLRAPSVSDAAAHRDADERRLRPLHHDHDGDARPARPRGSPRMAREAHLADRVRLPDEPARPDARRVQRRPRRGTSPRRRRRSTRPRASTC